MKKICILLVLICLCFLVASCGKENTDINFSAEEQNLSDISSNQTANSSSYTNGTVDKNAGTNSSTGVYIDPAPMIFDKIEEYESFIETQGLADGFVRYEDVCEFGEFQYLEFINDPWGGNYNGYRYFLEHDAGIKFLVDIDQIGGEFIENAEKVGLDYVNKVDLRRLKENLTGVYENDGIQYFYVKGELVAVSWKVSGSRYSLRGELEGYPLATEKETVIQKLLNLETAKDALIGIYGEAFGK